jgi:hypothetical protein
MNTRLLISSDIMLVYKIPDYMQSLYKIPY